MFLVPTIAVGGCLLWILATRRETSRLYGELGALREERGKLLAERDGARQRLEELRAEHEVGIGALKESFKILGTQAVLDAQPLLAEQASQAWTVLLKPLEERLREHQERLGQTETAQGRILAEVRLQLEQLSISNLTLARETESFRNVLRSGASRGRWGEETLRRVVEAAGLSPHCDFEEQVSEGDARPDLVVRLPGNRCIVVDAKVPDLDALGDQEDGALRERPARIAAHARVLRDTVRALSERRYPDRIEGAIDHVVLFLPAESLFSAALEGDRDLIRWAAERRVLLSTPSSLIALLRSVALGWQYWNQSENTRQVADSARELVDRLRVFAEHLGRVQKGLESAGSAWNQAVGSWQSRVLPQGQKMAELGVEARTPMVELPEASSQLRSL
jgi:DNA recombination protein RmuC